MPITPLMARRMRLTPESQYMLELWQNACTDADIPHTHSSLFIHDSYIGDKIVLHFLASDNNVRFAYAGKNIQKSLGVDLAGKSVADLFSGAEKQAMTEMAMVYFRAPVIGHTHSTTTTLAGELIQVEMLQVPFINSATGELLYAIGAFEWTHPNPNPDMDGLTTRALLFRKLYDVKTLLPIDSKHTYPPPLMRAGEAAE